MPFDYDVIPRCHYHEVEPGDKWCWVDPPTDRTFYICPHYSSPGRWAPSVLDLWVALETELAKVDPTPDLRTVPDGELINIDLFIDREVRCSVLVWPLTQGQIAYWDVTEPEPIALPNLGEVVSRIRPWPRREREGQV